MFTHVLFIYLFIYSFHLFIYTEGAQRYARVTRLHSGCDGLIRDNGSGADTVAFPPLPLKASQVTRSRQPK